MFWAERERKNQFYLKLEITNDLTENTFICQKDDDNIIKISKI